MINNYTQHVYTLHDIGQVARVKYQFLDIGWSNQLSTKHKRCIFKQTRLFAGNILERRTLANRDKLERRVSLLNNITPRYKRNKLEGWLFCWFPSPA